MIAITLILVAILGPGMSIVALFSLYNEPQQNSTDTDYNMVISSITDEMNKNML